MPPIQVLIVDDDDRFHQQMDAWPELPKDVTIVGAARDHAQAISLIRRAQPDVLLLGLGSFNTSNLRAILAQVRSRFPRLKVIVLHEEGQQDLVLEAFKEGARGHLVKRTGRADELVEAIRAVHRGDVVLSPRLAGSIVDEVISLKRRST